VRRPWKIALLAGAALFLAMQLVPWPTPRAILPGDGTISDHVPIPRDIDTLLRRACYDCHSEETRWPWYSRIAPASWYIAHDVQHGRSNLDFSSWSTDPDLEPTPVQRVSWMCRDIRRDLMPPKLYRLAHPEGRLTAKEKDAICAWSDEARGRLEAAPGPTSADPFPAAAHAR